MLFSINRIKRRLRYFNTLKPKPQPKALFLNKPRNKAKILAKSRKNYLPTFILTLVLWTLLTLLFFLTSPESTLIVITFIIILWLAIFFTLSAILLNARRSFIIATLIVEILFLRHLGIIYPPAVLILITVVVLFLTFVLIRN
ncbi:MAG: hypothetical protein CH104c_0619 [Candidatus Woesebacteria bacterium]|nr:MAG: hypothetical protein CH104c_0619 [Candidatus Woesebacteria bacterium]